MAEPFTKLFVSIRREDSSNVDFKKLILMIDSKIVVKPGETTISVLKRQVEKEYSDLFPFDDPLICSKLEDSYGYALSNVSKVKELLVNNDRIVAIPISSQHEGRKHI